MNRYCMIFLAATVFMIAGCNDKNDRADKGKDLLQAAKNGDESAVQSLIADGADLDATDDEGRTPLLLSIKDHPGVARILIEAGADVNARVDYRGRMRLGEVEDPPEFGASALQLAIYFHPELARLLLEKGADVNLPGESEISPLQDAVEVGMIDLVKDLLARGSDVNARNNLDFTALHLAAVCPVTEITKVLLAAGADVSARTTTTYGKGAKTALHYAAWIAHDDIVELLIAAKADVNAADGTGKTPLHCAAAGTTVWDSASEGGVRHEVKDAHIRIAGLLLEKGAEVNIKDKTGRTPLDYAKRATSEPKSGETSHRMVELLEKHGGHGGTGIAPPG